MPTIGNVLASNTAAFVSAFMARNHDYFVSTYTEEEAASVMYEVAHAAVVAASKEGNVSNIEAMDALGRDFLPVIGG